MSVRNTLLEHSEEEKQTYEAPVPSLAPLRSFPACSALGLGFSVSEFEGPFFPFSYSSLVAVLSSVHQKKYSRRGSQLVNIPSIRSVHAYGKEGEVPSLFWIDSPLVVFHLFLHLV